MKKISISFFLIFLSAIVAAQNIKVYVDRNMQATDSAKADSYIVSFAKAETDTVYQMRQFSLENQVIVAGSFKDAQLSIPHGHFFFYHIIREYKKNEKIDYQAYHKPIGRYLEKDGVYVNGKMNGVWIDYFENGSVKRRETFLNDVLNGPFELFNSNGEILSKGNFANGEKEGIWLEDSGLNERVYENGKLIKTKKNNVLVAELEKKAKEEGKYDVQAQPTVVFRRDIVKFMEEENKNNVRREKAVVRLSINEKGKLLDVTVSGLTDFTLRDKIKEFFLKYKTWQPATIGIEKKPIQSTLTYTLAYE